MKLVLSCTGWAPKQDLVGTYMYMYYQESINNNNVYVYGLLVLLVVLVFIRTEEHKNA